MRQALLSKNILLSVQVILQQLLKFFVWYGLCVVAMWYVMVLWIMGTACYAVSELERKQNYGRFLCSLNHPYLTRVIYL